jgi:hypothetical protein
MDVDGSLRTVLDSVTAVASCRSLSSMASAADHAVAIPWAVLVSCVRSVVTPAVGSTGAQISVWPRTGPDVYCPASIVGGRPPSLMEDSCLVHVSLTA